MKNGKKIQAGEARRVNSEGVSGGVNMSQFKVGDRVKVKDRRWWPGGYKIASWEGQIVEVKDDPAGYVIMKVDKTGYNMAFPEHELEKI